MRVFIQTQGLTLPREEQDHIRQRLRQVLARFGPHAMGATLHLRDINGPKGGQDKDCHLVVELDNSSTVVHDRGHKISSLVDRALHRAAHAIRKQLSRLNERPQRAPKLGRHQPGNARNRRMDRAMGAITEEA